MYDIMVAVVSIVNGFFQNQYQVLKISYLQSRSQHYEMVINRITTIQYDARMGQKIDLACIITVCMYDRKQLYSIRNPSYCKCKQLFNYLQVVIQQQHRERKGSSIGIFCLLLEKLLITRKQLYCTETMHKYK